MEPDVETNSLFDDSLLYELDFSKATCSMANGVCPREPGEGLCFRALRINDHAKGLPELLSQLTVVGDLPQEKFEAQFRAMQATGDTYYTSVVEDTTRGEIVAAASLIIERKFIHSAALRGRIEDVVVNDQYRGKQLGKLLIEALTQLGISLGCYKISLDCNDAKRGFYEKFGYKHEESVFMCRRMRA